MPVLLMNQNLPETFQIFFEIIEPQWRHRRISTESSNFHKVEASPRGPTVNPTPLRRREMTSSPTSLSFTLPAY